MKRRGSHAGVESRGLRVLLVDIHAPHAAVRRDVFHKYAAQSFPALFGRDEQHFEFPGFDACKGREAVFFVPYHIELLHAG